MGTSNAATLRALAAAREAAAQADILNNIRVEVKRAANNSQFLVDELMSNTSTPAPKPVEVTPDAP